MAKKRDKYTGELFIEESGQLRLLDKSAEQQALEGGEVTCLSKTFPNDDARREYFLEKLGEKLQSPEFREIEGFPFGSDEDILGLSDPPYFTACPNPWVAELISEWEAMKPEHPEGDHYHREPFAADVREGKNDPIYNAHSYHTKVPHKAIMRYILHFTEPGDIVFDGFCGTGMTGVAALMCGDREEVMALGYQVLPDGTILQQEINENGKTAWRPFSKLGVRKAVLNDLSPAATFIAFNYNTLVDVAAFEQDARQILNDVEREFGWMYETVHTDGKTKGRINYTVWSDVFVCPECASSFAYWEAAVEKETGRVLDKFICPACSAQITKRGTERAWDSRFDTALQETIREVKRVPVLINYSVGGKRFEKEPSPCDLDLIEKIDDAKYSCAFPICAIPKGDKTSEPLRIGISHVHHFFTKRNLVVFSKFYTRASNPLIRAALLGGYTVGLKTSRFLPLRWINKDTGPMKPHTAGTLYVPSLCGEQNWFNIFNARVSASIRAQSKLPNKKDRVAISTQSLACDRIREGSFDYIFLDPPFGANLNYSELNLFWESWLGVKTNNKPEAIESKAQDKGQAEYRALMVGCFREAFRALKPGRWMTVEFSNTKASVWNSIQSAIAEAGFIVANVSALDKKQGSFNAVNNTTSVKQDLVITAYKPSHGFEERFHAEAQTEEGVWDFVRTHLKYLPVTKLQGTFLQFIPERDPRILFDQMVSYYVRRGYLVPISSQEFQIGLAQRFSERDGMYFLSDQVAEYDRKMVTSGELKQMTMFVSGEASAIQWISQLIKEKPQTFSDINPQFMQQLSGWNKNEALLDLRELLNQNFLCYEGEGLVPEQIHAYLSTNWKQLRNLPKDDPALVAKARDRWYVPDPNKTGDLEKLRGKSLLKEFEEYRESKKKLKVVRIEAVRIGFKAAYDRQEYRTIIDVALKLPDAVLQEDGKLLMYYDVATTRLSEN